MQAYAPVREYARIALEPTTGRVRARDRVAASVLRTTLAAIDNAEAVPRAEADGEPVVGRFADVARHDLDEQQLVTVVRAEHQERVEAAALYECLGRPDDAAALQAEAQILAGYLPVE